MNLADGRIFKQPDVPRTHPKSGFRIIYHGNMTRRYGVDMAIRAVDMLRDKIPDIQLTLAGRGEYRDEATELVDQLRLQEHVRFLDTVPIPELPDLINQSDIGVTAYRVDGFTEGCLPTKLLEYTMLGIPTVASRTEVIADYFDDSQVEFCEPGNLEDLAKRIFALYSNPERFNELARNTSRFNDKYNWASMSAEYVGIIGDLHQNHRRRNGAA
jgi:glycosyltransferase EpsD